jgi:CRISPR-associated protein Csd1
MILQALNSYYYRLRENPDSGIAVPGFAPQKISHALILDREGRLLQIQDIRDTSGKTPRPTLIMVPEAAIRAVNIAANFLWDNTGYVLGLDNKGKPERTSHTFQAFKTLHHNIGDEIGDAGMRAVLLFLDSWNPEKAPSAIDWDEILGSNLVFRLHRERAFVHERPAVAAAWTKHRAQSSHSEEAICLVTGDKAPIARLHAKIKGVKDAQSTGAALVSFNLDAFCSYGKEQNYNAPISEEAAFAYTTALNHLLRFGSRQRVQIGDATTVFWTERASVVEDIFGCVLDPGHDPSANAADAKRLADYLKAVRAGKRPDSIDDDSMRFHILGLSPNASRLAARFWHVATVEAVNRHVGHHFADLALEREYENQTEFPGIWQLLLETATLRKSENIRPSLEGALMRSILEGIPYPTSLLSALVERIRADQEVGYYRVALIKAVLKRNYRREEVSMALNEESTNVAYRLGRLFSVLEKAQEEAVPGANVTIKDRFYGSASTTPSAVFPQLIRLSQHHLSKLEAGPKIHKEQLVQVIVDGIDSARGFPSHLNLEEQGMFALGYYQQRKAFFTKKPERTITQ